VICDAVLRTYPEHPILVLAYQCGIEKGTPKRVGCRDLRWVNLEQLEKLAMPPADAPIRMRLGSPEKGYLRP